MQKSLEHFDTHYLKFLVPLIRVSHQCYQTFVVKHGSQYDLFVAEFSGWIKHNPHRSETDIRLYNMSVASVEYLLNTFREMVKQWFYPPKLTDEDIHQIIRTYRSHPYDISIEQASLLKSKKAPPINSSFSLKCSFNKQQMDLIVECCNEVRLFLEPVDATTMKRLFSGTLTKVLTVKNMRSFACFFNQLLAENLICHTWQAKLERLGMLRTKNGKPVKAGHLARALHATKEARDSSERNSIVKMVKEISALGNI